MMHKKLQKSSSKAGLPPLSLVVPPQIEALCATYFNRYADDGKNGERRLRKTAQAFDYEH